MFSYCFIRYKKNISCFFCNKSVNYKDRILLNCYHIYHKSCYNNYLEKYKMNIICPICDIKENYKIL